MLSASPFDATKETDPQEPKQMVKPNQLQAKANHALNNLNCKSFRKLNGTTPEYDRKRSTKKAKKPLKSLNKSAYI